LFQGAAIAPHSQELVRLCCQVYREYPYLSDHPEDDSYATFLKTYEKMDDSIICMAFDGEKAIETATALPLKNMTDYVPIFQRFGEDENSYFYLGESERDAPSRCFLD